MQASARQPSLAGVEELVDQVLLNPDVAFKHIFDEEVGKPAFRAEHSGHFAVLDLPQQRHDLLRFLSLDRHVQLSFRVILSHSRWTKSSPSGQNDECSTSLT